MGSDGLFKPLVGRGSAVLDALAALHLPHVWRKIDQIGEAKDLAVSPELDYFISFIEYYVITRWNAPTFTVFFMF